ncbi:hypothetical protein DdX_06397 [Ditylenchus destructor]|uniref:Uncharacterized protein n=1 Tax=Ditylenchus destructor TaxID=166010 RepID=A0AAD4NAU6_9BILA|nr:hypothetical protein DdX_06397 [Ditylenchus destructor]
MAAECTNIQDSERNLSQNLQDGDRNERFTLPSSLLRKLMQMKLCDEECLSLKCRQEKENMRTAIMRLADAFNDIYDAYSKQDKTITEIIKMANGLCTNFNIRQKFEYSASEEKQKLNEMARMIRLYFMKTPRRNKRKQGNEVDENGLKDEKILDINCDFLDDDGMLDSKMGSPSGVAGGTTNKINGVMTPTQENLRLLQNGMTSGHPYGFNRDTFRFHSSPEPKRNRPNISRPAVNGISRICGEPTSAEPSGSASAQRINIPLRQTVRGVMATAHQSNLPLYPPLTVNTANSSGIPPPINGCRPMITIRDAPNIGAVPEYATLKQHLNQPSSHLAAINTRHGPPAQLLTRSPQRRFNNSHGSSNGYRPMQFANGEPSSNQMGVGSRNITKNTTSQPQVPAKVMVNPEGGCNLYILQGDNRRYLAIEQIPFATPAGLTYSHPLPLPRLKSTQISTLNASFCFKIYASGKDVPEVNSFQATIKYSETGACVVNLLLKYRYIGDNQKLYLYYYLSDVGSLMPHTPVWEDGNEFTCRETGLSVKLEFVDIRECEVLFLSFRIGTSSNVKGKFTTPVAIQLGRAHDGIMINADFAYFRDKEKQMENEKESKAQVPALKVGSSAVRSNDEIVVLE